MGDLSEEELIFWQARWEVGPWGEFAEWSRHGSRMAQRENLTPSTKKNRKPAQPADYIPEPYK